MKHFLFIVLAVFLLVSCYQNEPSKYVDDSSINNDENVQLHQPADYATWSPIGKKYVRDRSNEHVLGNDYFFEVVWFQTKDSAVWYNSIYPDLSQMYQSYYVSYEIEYPKAYLTFFEINRDEYYFTDTLTLYCSTSSGIAFKLLE
mgnify:CR=1 FL=1